MSHTFNFQSQKRIGDLAEDMVRENLSNHFTVETVTDLKIQKKGIDFLISHSGSPEPLKVETKLDTWCPKNGNYYLEIATKGGLGWVYSCTSDFIFLCSGLEGDCLITTPDIIREHIARYSRVYQTKKCNPGGYWSEGVCTPLRIIPGVRVNLREERVDKEMLEGVLCKEGNKLAA